MPLKWPDVHTDPVSFCVTVYFVFCKINCDKSTWYFNFRSTLILNRIIRCFYLSRLANKMCYIFTTDILCSVRNVQDTYQEQQNRGYLDCLNIVGHISTLRLDDNLQQTKTSMFLLFFFINTLKKDELIFVKGYICTEYRNH